MRRLRVGVVGLGQRIAHVLAALVEVGGAVELSGVLDPAPVGASILTAVGLESPTPAPDMTRFLAGGPYDLLMIGSPNHLHLEHLLAVLGAGAPVFCEKPIVRTEAESYELARRLGPDGAPPVFVGLVMRSMPIVRSILVRIARGDLGRIVSIDATEHLPPEHGAYLARNWRRRQAFAGSYLLDKVCHDFDIFQSVAGARASHAASFGGRSVFTGAGRDRPRRYSDGAAAFDRTPAGWSGVHDAFSDDMDVADHQTAIVRYASGVVLSFHSNTLTALQERRWYIAGDEGTLMADLVRNRLMQRGVLDLARPERVDFGGRTADSHNGADQAMCRDLLDALTGAAAFPATPRLALEAGLTVMAVDEAMAGAKVVDLSGRWRALDAAWGR